MQMNAKQTRRRFIKTIGAAAIGASAIERALGQPEIASIPTDLVVIKGSAEMAVMKIFEQFGGIARYVTPNCTVLLKPNVSFPNPKTVGSTTSPELVKAIAEAVLQAGAKRVIVADHTMGDSTLCFQKTGIEAALSSLQNVKIMPLDQENLYAEVPVPNGIALKSVKIAKLIERCDLFINMPCAKSHLSTQVSFGLKNLMGLIWDRQFFHSGTDLHTAIAELATIIKPHFTILDATRSLVTGGPTGPGKIQETKTFIAGVDPLAVDSYAASFVNWNNRTTAAGTIEHLTIAAKLGVGQSDLEKLKILQLSV
jgi:uncharacterized protein (DUF362 family)